ncbi:MAG: hypothetical protein ACRCYT_04800 [Cetobacterium sp.]
MSTKIKNTLGCVSDLGSRLTNSEINTLSEIIHYASKNSAVARRAGTTTDPSLVRDKFVKSIVGYQMKPVALFGDYKYMYERANETVLKISNPKIIESNLNNVILKLDKEISKVSVASANKEKSEEMNIVSNEALNVNFARFESFFRILNNYNCIFKCARKLTRKNILGYSEASVAFDFAYDNRIVFNIELPLVNTDGRFTRNGNEYIVNLMAENFFDYAMGTDDTLVLTHPYEYLIEALLTRSTDDGGLKSFYTPDVFGKMIESSAYNKDKSIKSIQSKLSKILMNAELDYHNDRNTNSPIMWVDKHFSDYSKHLNKQMIGVFADYNTMIAVSNQNGTFTVPGLDLLTGSTSEPAKRCNIAVGYKINYINNKLCVVKKAENLHELSQIFSEYKFSNPGTLRTSAKRDNSCTVTSTYNLVTPQTYKKRVRVEFK